MRKITKLISVMLLTCLKGTAAECHAPIFVYIDTDVTSSACLQLITCSVNYINYRHSVKLKLL